MISEFSFSGVYGINNYSPLLADIRGPSFSLREAVPFVTNTTRAYFPGSFVLSSPSAFNRVKSFAGVIYLIH